MNWIIFQQFHQQETLFIKILKITLFFLKVVTEEKFKKNKFSTHSRGGNAIEDIHIHNITTIGVVSKATLVFHNFLDVNKQLLKFPHVHFNAVCCCSIKTRTLITFEIFLILSKHFFLNSSP